VLAKVYIAHAQLLEAKFIGPETDFSQQRLGLWQSNL
jgi:hypothetical protein